MERFGCTAYYRLQKAFQLINKYYKIIQYIIFHSLNRSNRCNLPIPWDPVQISAEIQQHTEWFWCPKSCCRLSECPEMNELYRVKSLGRFMWCQLIDSTRFPTRIQDKNSGISSGWSRSILTVFWGFPTSEISILIIFFKRSWKMLENGAEIIQIGPGSSENGS